jgi:hypothetical protein
MTDSKNTDRPSTLSIALAVLDAHPLWYLFPIKRGLKTPPLFKNELETNNSNDPKKIEAWHERFPGCNWGIALKKSKLIVVDCDTKPGKVGEATLSELEFTYGELPPTLTVRTPSGGRHYYFDEANGVKHRMAVSGFGKDVDSTNYVVCAGCKLDAGGEYTITTDAPIAPAPAWFGDVLGAAVEPVAAADQTPLVEQDTPAIRAECIAYLTTDAPPAILGENGDAVTLQVCGVLKDMGASKNLALELMADYYNGRCNPPWSFYDGPTADRMDVKIDNAWKYLTQNAPGSATPEADFADDPVPDFTVGEKRQQAAIRKTNRPRPKLMAPAGALTRVMARVQQIVSNQMDLADPVFKRQGKLVHLSRNLSEGGPQLKEFERDALVIADVGEAWLASRLERSIEFVAPVGGRPEKPKKGEAKEPPKPADDTEVKPINCPAILCKRILADSTNWPKYKTLHSTLETPTLRADGTILSTPGYDEASGLFYDPGDVVFPPIPQTPTRAQGDAAIAMVLDVIRDFPFDGDVSKAVALSMMLMAPVRRTLNIAPVIGIDADDQEAGKTTLGKVAGAIATGRDIAVHPFATGEEERAKLLTALLLTAAPVMLFDNIDDLIESVEIEKAITSAMYEGRPFGKNDTIRNAPTNALMIFTGNKIRVGGTFASRMLVTRLEPKVSLAERTFKHRDLIGYVIKERPRLVAAILTALRAYIVHGKGKVKLGDNDRFPAWSDLIRSAVVWYGFADPLRGGDKLRANDPIKEAQREVLRRWWLKFLGEPVTARDLAKGDITSEAFADGLKCRPADVTSFKVAPYVEKMIGIKLGLPVNVIKERARLGSSQKFRLELAANTSPDWVQADTLIDDAAEPEFGPGEDA